MLGQQTEPIVNNIRRLFDIQVVTDESEGVIDLTPEPTDLGAAKERDEIIVLDVGNMTNVDAGFIEIHEKLDDLTNLLCVFKLSESKTQMQRIHRKWPFIQVIGKIEFEQPDEENPVETSIPLSIMVLQ